MSFNNSYIMFTSSDNFRIAMTAAALSIEDIIREIERDIKDFRATKNDTKLAASTMLFHVKMGMIKKYKTEDPVKTFEELEKFRQQQKIFQTNPQ